MRKIISLLGLVLLVEMMNAADSLAARQAHRPWLLIGSVPAAPRAAVPPPVKTIEAPRRSPRLRREGVRRAAAPKTGRKIASRALQYKGTRYKFGGTSRRGLDCSGLVARVYEDLRMKRIPRASHALYKAGNPVRLSDLRPGDLIFFKNTYRRGISHVGVYAGHNKFVHASNRKRGVIITALSDPYYQLHYAGARRLY